MNKFQERRTHEYLNWVQNSLMDQQTLVRYISKDRLTLQSNLIMEEIPPMREGLLRLHFVLMVSFFVIKMWNLSPSRSLPNCPMNCSANWRLDFCAHKEPSSHKRCWNSHTTAIKIWILQLHKQLSYVHVDLMASFLNCMGNGE